MLLINKISFGDFLSYKQEHINCLIHNSNNGYISEIFVFIDGDNKDLPKHPKIKYFVKKYDEYQLLEISKKYTSQSKIIWSKKSLIGFNEDLRFLLTEPSIYKTKDFIIINKDTKISKDLVIDEHFKNPKISTIDFGTIHKKNNPIEKELKLENIRRKGDLVKSKNLDVFKKLNVIIVSVNYNDFLLPTLTRNIETFDNITVVTSNEDKMCQMICEKFKVNYITTDIMYDEGAKFNKGKAINLAINSIKDPGFILLIDADIIVKDRINTEYLDTETLYTSDRWMCETYDDLYKWETDVNSLKKHIKNESDRGLGFFQLFHYSKAISYPETSENAAFSDLLFRDKFTQKQTIKNHIIHLGKSYTNWDGRKTDRFIEDAEFQRLFESIGQNKFDINSYFDKIYCLNLERNSEKWQKTNTQFKELNINVDRFLGIDGNDITDDEFNEISNRKISEVDSSKLGLIENKYALGCLMSHIEIIKEAKSAKYKRILIFEDDVILSNEFNERISQINKLSWELLYLGASQFNWTGVKVNNGFYKCSNTLGTFAYAINSNIYDDLLELFETKRKSIDNLLSEYQLKNNQSFVIYPNIVISDVSQSDIRQSKSMDEYSKLMKWNLESFNFNIDYVVSPNSLEKLIKSNHIELVKKSTTKTSKKSILFLIYLNDTGGAEYVSYQHIKACKELGYNVVVISAGKGMFFEKTKLLDVDLYHSKLNEIDKSKVYEVLESLTNDVDIVYNCNYFGISEYIHKVKENKNFKYYTIAHSDIEWVTNEVYKHDIITDKYIVIHDKIRNELNKKGVCNTRISTVPNYVEFYKIQDSYKNFDNRNLKRKFRILNNEFIIGMITRISPDKNILDAIKILSKLDNNTKLLIVGDAPEKEESKPYKNEVLDEIKKYNLQDRVIITGHVNNEDVIKYASCFNIAINTSPSEGLPISLLEQMSIGIHCVYPSHGEIPLVLSGCGSVIEMKQRKSFDPSSDDYIFSRFKDFEIDMFVNEIKSILNKNTIDKNKIIERIKYHRSSENAKYYLDFLYGGYKEGVSFVIRARNEILNIQDCIDSISDIADEIIFVDHLSTDGTYEKALELSKIYDNLKVFRYDREIPKPGPNYQNNINILGNSIAQYYNFCLSKSTRKTIFKWDADFIANRENLNKLITSYSLRTRDDKFSMWFTGETVFIKDEKKYINKDSFYDEYRGFSLSNGVKWEDAIRCEYVDRKYANSSIALRFEDPCFYEIKRLDIDEFEHREGLIDERDRKDFQIIQDLQLNNIPSYLEEIENLNKKVIITYGTFDTFHFGHMEIIKRAKKMGDYLIVGISTDSFNLLKNKISRFNYEQRKEWIESIKQVDLVIPEESWEQKVDDIRKYKVNTFVMGDDWKGKFDNLPCDVVYLPRTENISSTEIKKIL